MPPTHASAAILSVGDELTLGQSLDTNARWLAARLVDLGVTPLEHVTVPDDLDAHAAALTRLAPRVDLIVSTGGLGPTRDDLTREAMARAMNDTLVVDPMALAHLEAWYAARGRDVREGSRTQAMRPSRASILPNPHGTAPGLAGAIAGGADVFCMPGPPREMTPMFEAHVAPRITPRAVVRTRVLHTFGVAESDLAARLGPLMRRDAVAKGEPMVGTTASAGSVSVRMRCEGAPTPAEAEARLDACERACRDAAGAYVFGTGSDTLAGVVLAHLRARGQTVGCVESCTGGLVSTMLTDEPGSSAAFIGSLVSYSNGLKSSLVGVPASLLLPPGPGAVSAETARAMAVGGLRALACDHCLAVTGIAGPSGAVPARDGRPAKPVGTVFIARADASQPDDPDVREFVFPGERGSIREWSARTALAMLWQHLAGLPPLTLLRQK
ncbi:MAG TPA: CinA family nicotinamide mononucleotide deamidase-related protein [Phycisphaerales bacterium]|nr:CinA family nicotinamide mononucleotide deamidase-related protein [Phycisphaerales bacterium]